jgi:TonB family protein
MKRGAWFAVAAALLMQIDAGRAEDSHYSGEARALLASYCTGVRSSSDPNVLDPTTLVDTAPYIQPMPTEVLGQQIKAASRRLGLQGNVTLGVIVTFEGKARATQVMKSSGLTQLDDEAVAILNSAAFAPARIDGVNTTACTIISIVFIVK